MQRRLFVLSHEAAVAEDIGAEYGSELALHAPIPGQSFRPASIVVNLLRRGRKHP